MKANELRIGNLVECFGIREVISIKEHKIKVRNESEKGHFIIEWCPIDSSSLKPITLTEEILAKLGFIEVKHFWHELKYFTDCEEYAECFLISYNVKSKRLGINDPESDSDIFYTGKKIKHLHELQNLYFSLTKNELSYE